MVPVMHIVRETEIKIWLDLGWEDLNQSHLSGWKTLIWRRPDSAIAPFAAVKSIRGSKNGTN